MIYFYYLKLKACQTSNVLMEQTALFRSTDLIRDHISKFIKISFKGRLNHLAFRGSCLADQRSKILNLLAIYQVIKETPFSSLRAHLLHKSRCTLLIKIKKLPLNPQKPNLDKFENFDIYNWRNEHTGHEGIEKRQRTVEEFNYILSSYQTDCSKEIRDDLHELVHRPNGTENSIAMNIIINFGYGCPRASKLRKRYGIEEEIGCLMKKAWSYEMPP